MNKNTLLIVIAAGIALATGLFVQRLSATKQLEPNAPAIAFSLPDLTGKQRNINEWQDKIRIINFWATWCPPCLKEIPEFIKLQNDYDKHLQFIGIAIDDQQAVEEYLKNRGNANQTNEKSSPDAPETLACGCPSTQMQTLSSCNCNDTTKISGGPAPASALGHWPVQIRLIPAHAPFLKNSNILVLADCAAVAYASLHQELLADRIVMMGCPKFDDLPDYEERFTEMFTKNEIKSVTVVTMEVPCCSGLPVAVKNALQKAGKITPFKEMVISLKGEVLK